MATLEHRSNKKFNLLCLSFIFSFFFFSNSTFAAIVITNQTGTIKIDQPNGQVITIQPGEKIPTIPSGSKLMLINGSAEISATEADTATLLISNGTIMLKDGAKVKEVMALESGDAHIEVLNGSVQVVKDDGTVLNLGEGDTTSAPALADVQRTRPPGADPVQNVARQKDAEQGLVGYS